MKRGSEKLTHTEDAGIYSLSSLLFSFSSRCDTYRNTHTAREVFVVKRVYIYIYYIYY